MASHGSPSQGLQPCGGLGLQSGFSQCHLLASSPAAAGRIYETIAMPAVVGHVTALPFAGEHIQCLTSLVRSGVISPSVEVRSASLVLLLHDHRVRTSHPCQQNVSGAKRALALAKLGSHCQHPHRRLRLRRCLHPASLVRDTLRLLEFASSQVSSTRISSSCCDSRAPHVACYPMACPSSPPGQSWQVTAPSPIATRCRGGSTSHPPWRRFPPTPQPVDHTKL